MPDQQGISVTGVVNQGISLTPKRATVNLEEQVDEETEGADPYSFTPNEIQDDDEGELLGSSLVIQRLLFTPRRELND